MWAKIRYWRVQLDHQWGELNPSFLLRVSANAEQMWELTPHSGPISGSALACFLGVRSEAPPKWCPLPRWHCVRTTVLARLLPWLARAFVRSQPYVSISFIENVWLGISGCLFVIICFHPQPLISVFCFVLYFTKQFHNEAHRTRDNCHRTSFPIGNFFKNWVYYFIRYKMIIYHWFYKN